MNYGDPNDVTVRQICKALKHVVTNNGSVPYLRLCYDGSGSVRQLCDDAVLVYLDDYANHAIRACDACMTKPEPTKAEVFAEMLDRMKEWRTTAGFEDLIAKAEKVLEEEK